MEKLQTLFIGYSECPPVILKGFLKEIINEKCSFILCYLKYAFVLCGNFLSELKYGLRCDEMIGNLSNKSLLNKTP